MIDDWFPVVVNWWCHPKTVDLSLEAHGLWLKARSYVAHNHTDGYISNTVVKSMVGDRSDVPPQLVEAKLWEVVTRDMRDIGFRLHNFDEHASGLEKKRAKDRERQQRFREAKRDKPVTSEPKNVTKRDVSQKVTAVTLGHTQIETKTKSKRYNPPTPLWGEVMAVWNDNCAPLPPLRKPHEFSTRAVEYFDGDLAEMAASVRRCSLDEHYRTNKYGFKNWVVNLARWGAAPGSPPTAPVRLNPKLAKAKQMIVESQPLGLTVGDLQLENPEMSDLLSEAWRELQRTPEGIS